jgi:hypothetical protein
MKNFSVVIRSSDNQFIYRLWGEGISEKQARERAASLNAFFASCLVEANGIYVTAFAEERPEA